MHIWTAKERAFLKLHYSPLSPEPWPTARISAFVGASVQAVRKAAYRFGVLIPERVVIGDLTPAIRKLHAQGLTDVEMAVRLDVCTTTLRRKRRDAGLDANFRPGYKPKASCRQAAHRRHCYWRARGYKSAFQYTHERKRIAAEFRRRGCRSARECEVMEALDSGPLLAREIAAAVGSGYGYTAHLLVDLLRRGLVRKSGWRPTDIGQAIVWESVPQPVYDEEDVAS
jgi:hypothetical protein